ncbi:MAG TPA: lmo0937 family membrane protein [Verrucomicrobiae bacterium]|nr:lmo0937 family membrane protein [Verrucomicrobiae bacterium]
MYLAIGGTLGVLWVLGMLYGYRMGGAIYLLLAAAMVMVFLGLRQWWRQPA